MLGRGGRVLLGELLDDATALHDLAALAAAGEVGEEVGEGVLHAVAALPDGEDADAGDAAEEPEDADDDPAGEELLAEDVAGAIL